MVLFQYACDIKAEVFGKPSSLFFQSVLNDMGLQPHEVCHCRQTVPTILMGS